MSHSPVSSALRWQPAGRPGGKGQSPVVPRGYEKRQEVDPAWLPVQLPLRGIVSSQHHQAAHNHAGFRCVATLAHLLFWSPSPSRGVLGRRVDGHAGAVNTRLTGRGQITFAQDIPPELSSTSFPDNLSVIGAIGTVTDVSGTSDDGNLWDSWFRPEPSAAQLPPAVEQRPPGGRRGRRGRKRRKLPYVLIAAAAAAAVGITVALVLPGQSHADYWLSADGLIGWPGRAADSSRVPARLGRE